MRLTVDITKEEYNDLKELAKECNVTVSDIISNYVYDLVGSGNGSDERDFARRYFERTWVSWLNKDE
jgi:hypothetical protein